MVIAVSTVVKKTMAWRCSDEWLEKLDSQTIGLAKGASMALITYFAIKLVGVAHDNEWGYLATGWGQWFMLELFAGVLLPLGVFAYGITFNWNLYQEIPHLFEMIIAVTLFAVYIATYRFILYRLPIVYAWKPQLVEVPVRAAERDVVPGALGQPSAAYQDVTLLD
jgi:hypothetical protein